MAAKLRRFKKPDRNTIFDIKEDNAEEYFQTAWQISLFAERSIAPKKSLHKDRESDGGKS